MSGVNFVKIGDNRIKISNIKNYGVSTKNLFYQKVYKVVEERTLLQRLLTSREWIETENLVNINEVDAENIKNGIQPLCVYRKKGSTISSQKDFNGNMFYVNAEKDGNYYLRIDEASARITDLITKSVRYLYITTFQNDNYTFYEDEVDIDNIINMIDENV